MPGWLHRKLSSRSKTCCMLILKSSFFFLQVVVPRRGHQVSFYVYGLILISRAGR